MWEKATDVDSTGGPTLQRNYNSTANVQNNAQGWPAEGFGYGWRTNYSRHVLYSANDTTVGAYVERPGGQILYFGQNSTTGAWSSDPDVHSTLTELTASNGTLTGWTYFDEDSGDTETYNSYGNLIQIVKIGGRALTFAYDGYNNLTSIVDDEGHSLTFAYPLVNGIPTGEVQSVTDSAGSVWNYTYNTTNYTLTQVTNPDGSAIVYHYENTNNPTLVTGEGYIPAGGTEARYSWFTYDSNSRVTQGYDGGNANQTALTYGSNGAVTVTYTLSATQTQTRNYTFNVVQGMSKLASIAGDCDSRCGPQSTNFDTNGNLLSETDFNGVVTNYSYSPDGSGLETQRIEAVGTAAQRTIQADWNETLRLPVERRTLDSASHLVSREDWIYNTVGSVLAHCEIDLTNSATSGYACSGAGTPPAGVRRWIYTYCGSVNTTQCPLLGLLLTATGPRTDLTQTSRYAYYMLDGVNHHHGDLKSVTDPLGHVTTYLTYDADGRVLSLRRPDGVYEDYTYTPRGWLASHTVRVTSDNSPSSSDATTTITYWPYGAVHTVTDPDGVVLTYTYDAAHRLTDITDALGKHIHYTLDAAGHRTQTQVFTVAGAVARSESRTYNTLGELTSIVDGLNQTVFNASAAGSYDANGNLVQSSDGLGIPRQQSYDALNRLIQTIDNYNGADPATRNTTTTYQYDSLDRLTQVTDPSQLTTTYGYDGLGDATGQTSPDTGITARTFDAAGNVLTRTDAKGITATYTYDADDRLTRVSYPDSSQTIAYYYDEPNTTTGCTTSRSIGRLTRIVEKTVTTVYCYGGHGNVSRKQQITALGTDTTRYTYTHANRLSSLTYPDGLVVGYTYNANGLLATVQATPAGSSTPITVVSGINWYSFGPMSRYTLGNGQAVTRSYDANYRLTDLTSPAFNLHVARDAMGDITAIGNSPGANPASETYRYDPLYRLTAITEANGRTLESVTYNPTGDRLSKTGSGLATGSYSYNPNTHQLVATSSYARAVDANGNTTGITAASGNLGFSYNARNRMGLAQVAGATVANYTYDALGERIRKVTGATERYGYDESQQLLSEQGATHRDYVWMGGIPVANVDVAGTTSTTTYVTADQLGTPRAIANASGTTVWQLPYQGNAWGENAPTSSGYIYNLRFPGQYFDVETGLNYNVVRYYDSAIGRFDQADPSGFKGGIGLYVYGFNSPLMYVDPTGLCPSDDRPTGEKKIDPGPKWCPMPTPPNKPLEPLSGFSDPTAGCQAAFAEKAEACVKKCPGPTVAMCEEAWRIKADNCALKAMGG